MSGLLCPRGLLRGAHCRYDNRLDLARRIVHVVIHDIARNDVLGYRDGGVTINCKPLSRSVWSALRGNQRHVDALLREEGVDEMLDLLGIEVVAVLTRENTHRGLKVRGVLSRKLHAFLNALGRIAGRRADGEVHRPQLREAELDRQRRCIWRARTA